MEFGQRLKAIRKSLGFTQEVLASKLGIKRAAYAAYEEGRAVPKFSILKKICLIANVNIDELLELETNDNRVKSIGSYNLGSIIPIVPIKAAAGYQNGFPDPNFINELPHLNLPMLGQGNFRAFELSGDSMLPLVSGTIVVGEKLEKLDDLKDGKTYILVTRQDGIVYKRVFNYLKDKGVLFLVSDNTQYKPYTIDPLDIEEIWTSKAYVSVQFP